MLVDVFVQRRSSRLLRSQYQIRGVVAFIGIEGAVDAPTSLGDEFPRSEGDTLHGTVLGGARLEEGGGDVVEYEMDAEFGAGVGDRVFGLVVHFEDVAGGAVDSFQ